MKLLQITVAIVLGLAVNVFAADEGWVDLFNGKDLTGWVQRGGKASYTVENGVLVGSSVVDTPNSFLCTEKNYDNFILELEFKCNPKLNSGVQVRSECFETEKKLNLNGKDKVIPAGRVHGYQIEIDMDPGKKRWWVGGIYDEARRAWLFPGALGGDGKAFTEQGARLAKQEDWNKFRVECIGSSIKTFLNGEQRAAITDSMTPTGLIGLQVHGVGKDKAKEGMKVCWRNIRIKPVAVGQACVANPVLCAANCCPAPMNTLTDDEKKAGWKLLWDGKTTNGWRSAKGPKFPEKGWEIKDGMLMVMPAGGKESDAGGDIITVDKYSSFELKAEFRLTPGANSGIKFFVDPELNKGPGSSIGLEFQVLDDSRHPDAKLGRDGNRTIGSCYDLIAAPKDKKVKEIGEWNEARIVSKGKHVEYYLNGVKTVEYDRGSKEFRELVAKSKYAKWPNFGELPSGHILLQEHGDQVWYRNVKIRVLPE